MTDESAGRQATTGGRRAKVLAVCALSLLVGLTLAIPASAMPTGPGVRDGRNITVFGNLDFVAAFGYQTREKLTVDVYRGDTRIATAFGLAVDTPEGGGLEVNHGVEGNVVQGDCWENFTPDVRPGDRIVVTDAAGVTDQILVDNITMPGPAQDNPATLDPFDVIVEGTASYADGSPIPIDQLNSGEVRSVSPRLRANPTRVERIDGTQDGWRAIYEAPYEIFDQRGALTTQQQKQAILNGDHAMGYGHVAPLPAEAQLVEGLGTGGPAPGCEALAPDAPDSALGVASPELITQANVNENVAVSGVIQDGVDVGLQLNGVEAPAADVDRANGTWSALIPASGLREGDNEVKATFTGPGAPAQPQTATVEKDTVSPPPATATPRPGLYNTNQSVSLGVTEAGAKIRYTTDGSDPTATTGTLYDGQQINVTSSQTIKAIVVDAAGNPSSVASFGYTIDRVAPSLTSNFVSGSYDAAQMVPFTSDDPGAEIRYTTDGSTPNRTSKLYTGPVRIAKTQTVKAVAYDAAGNASGVQSRTVTIRKATTTNLNVPTADMKLGNTRAIAGGVSPNQAGSFVRVTIDRPGDLPNATRGFTLNAFSRFGFTYRPTAVGTYRVKASFVKDADGLGSTSAVKSFRVVR
ncbi:hypothetical protein GBA63_01130 [Rubrobacter tropicus]|uniref:GH29D-like beta-sandwich domain-containing protein n=1 Tax=Rubrobacter tropicus TaxID=2653851 RepID=A0A6G8Q4I2_9ACTN|nr:chitobiase/beta-hexosaminidase C-terminal domain-containing protein [Rubrobacter tropicus]QIN81381.1 hypothetical protein GBA63_01130 [Rubrobacter tropicus]